MNSPVDPGARQALKKKPPERTPEVRPADPSSLPLSNGQLPPVGLKVAATVPLPEPRTCLPGYLFSAFPVLNRALLAGG